MLKAIAAMIGFKVAGKTADGLAGQEFVFHNTEDIWLMLLLFVVALLGLYFLGRWQKRTASK